MHLKRSKNTSRFIIVSVILGIVLIQIVIVGISQSGVFHRNFIDEPGEIDPPIQKKAIPRASSSSRVPIAAYNNQIPDLKENIDDLSQLNQSLIAFQYLDMRPTSIPATYYTITALKALGSQYLASYADGFEAFFLSRLNESNLHFEETINYSYIAQKAYQGASTVFRVLTPDLIHQMALISLAEIGLLSEHFGSAEIDQWVTEIKNTNNTDGGFGTYVDPDSTIHETYFAVKALYALNGFQLPDLSPAMVGDVLGFLGNSQYGYVEMLPFLEGSIREYDDSDPYYGWESFDVDLQAFRICEFLGAESTSLSAGFLGFVADNDLFIQEDNHWVHNWNSKFGSGGDAWGTAIIGECLRILDAQAQFETEIDQSINAITTHYQQTGISEGKNWIYTRMNERTEIYSQCLILEYLNRTGVGSEVLDANERGGIAQFFGSFIGHDGGCSYVPTDRMSTEGLFHQYLFCETESLTQAQKDGLYSDIYDLYWEDVLNGGYYFTDHRKDFKLELLDYHHLALEGLHSTYYGLALLHKFDLFDRLYGDIGLQWLEMEQWLADLRHSSGKFLPHQDYDYHPADLQTTYMALQSLQWLFEYNEGQTFSEYFTQAQLDGTASYIRSFIMEENNSWLVKQTHLNEFEATYYGVRALEILDKADSEVEYDKLRTTFIAELTKKWQQLGIKQRADGFRIANHLGLGQNSESSPLFHAILENVSHWVESNITTQMGDGYLDYQTLEFLRTVHKSSYREVHMDIPEFQIPGNEYTYSFKMVSPLSLIPSESVSQVSLVGLDHNFDVWLHSNWINSGVIPEFNQSSPDPFLWCPILELSHEGKNYYAPLVITYATLGSSESDYRNRAEEIQTQTSIFTDKRVFDLISPMVSVYATQGESFVQIIESVPEENLFLVETDEGAQLNVSVSKQLLNYSAGDFQVRINFQQHVLAPIRINFPFNYSNFLDSKGGSKTENAEDSDSLPSADSDPGDNSESTSLLSGDVKFGLIMLSCTAIPGVSVFIVKNKKKKEEPSSFPL